MMGGYWHGWGMPFGGLFSLLVLVLILVTLYRALGTGKTGTEALAVLEQRYAKGEIQREEYLEKKRDLAAK